MDATGTVTARVVTDSGPRSCAYCPHVRRYDLRVVDTYTADGREWVCYRCATRRSPRLVAAVDWYERELDALADDKLVSVGRARAICDESVALLTEGLDPRQTRVVVGTESDVARLQRAADRVADRRTLAPASLGASRRRGSGALVPLGSPAT